MKCFLRYAVLAAAAASSARATMVTYSASGSFFGSPAFTTGDGTDTVTVGQSAVLMYIGPGPFSAPVVVNTATNPTNISYGFIAELYTDSSGNSVNIPAFTFNLVVTDLSNGIISTFVGTAAASSETPTSSTLSISYSPPSRMAGNATFFVNSPTTMPAPMQISIDGSVSTTGGGTSTPEPGSLLLFGAGIAALAMPACKKVASRL